MVKNVHIKGIGTYQPHNKVDVDYYIETFKEFDKDITDLLNTLNRKILYKSNDLNENILTMGVEAASKALSDANVKPEEIDMLVFVSDTPEYTTPTNALKAHHQLNTKNAHFVYDLNANCVGMLAAIDQVSRTLKTEKRVKKALIIGAVLISAAARKDDILTMATFSDSGAAVVLEGIEEEEEKGLISSSFYADSCMHDLTHNPKCGFSTYLRTNIEDKEEAKWMSIPFDASYIPGVWSRLIKELLEDNKLEPDDIKHFIFSQFAPGPVIESLNIVGVTECEKKITFIADEIGYTGATCLVFALERALKDKSIKAGDKVIFCGMGVGYSALAFYYQF